MKSKVPLRERLHHIWGRYYVEKAWQAFMDADANLLRLNMLTVFVVIPIIVVLVISLAPTIITMRTFFSFGSMFIGMILSLAGHSYSRQILLRGHVLMHDQRELCPLRRKRWITIRPVSWLFLAGFLTLLVSLENPFAFHHILALPIIVLSTLDVGRQIFHPPARCEHCGTVHP